MGIAATRALIMALIGGQVSALTGCSLTMTNAPSTLAVSEVPDCTESRIPPSVDLAIGLLAGIITIPLVQELVKPRCGNDCGVTVPATLGFGASAILFGLSSYRGWSVSSRCRHQNDAHDRWAAANILDAKPVIVSSGESAAGAPGEVVPIRADTAKRDTAKRAPSPRESRHDPYRWLLAIGLTATAVLVGIGIYELSKFHL